MEAKLPYYMMYPTPILSDRKKLMDRDYDYLRSMYPNMAKRLLPYVEDECDKYEYEESMIYDEYPDKLQLRLMCRRIFDRAREQEDDDWDEKSLRDMVDILLYQELLRRRENRRRSQRRIMW